MKLTKKRLIALFMVLTLSMGLLISCSGEDKKKDDVDVTETTGDVKTEDEKVDDVKEEVKTEVITLSFPCIWVGADSKAAVFGEMIKGFNEEYAGKYEIKVEEQTDYDAYRDKIRTLITTGTAPDIFTLDNYADMQLFSESGKLMDLTSFFAEADMASRFFEGTIENSKVSGLNYGFPYESAIIPIMFNQKLLDAAGVTKVPTTYDELWEACELLKAAGVFPTTQMTNDNAWTSMLWYSYAVAACGGPDVYSNGLDDPAFVKAAEIMQKMYEYTSSDAVGADASVVNGHFFNERAAIYTNGSWILGRIKTEGVAGLYDNLTLSPGLSYDGQNGGAYVNAVQAYFAAGKQEDPAKEEAVKEFFKYITDPEKVAELANSSGSLFAINIDMSKISDPLQAKIIEQSSQAPFMIGHFQGSVPTTVVNAFPAALEALVLGDTTPEEFVAELNNTVE